MAYSKFYLLLILNETLEKILEQGEKIKRLYIALRNEELTSFHPSLNIIRIVTLRKVWQEGEIKKKTKSLCLSN
jgi:hypothetical protein